MLAVPILEMTQQKLVMEALLHISIVKISEHLYRVKVVNHGVARLDHPVDSYELACAYGQGLAAGIALAMGRSRPEKIIYPHAPVTLHVTVRSNRSAAV